ncbi:hypothetical protein [Achromobacter ruhlandii]|jgi:hypothetical protein|uniref:hypothetical protein n=1 Tax=Achromobacter ruhlandii TaxID=72557 RepID=UPI0015825407|nr:hypothetical protein [Achromobacter ruhlandii]MCI1837594.1 hypothetical protein [Achromobacter ruhlandii]MCZ8396037.1 hypothetical protein [Achromobacter ruhlandii]
MGLAVRFDWLGKEHGARSDHSQLKLLKQRFEEIMNFWVPVIFGTFKILVLGTGMFLAIKSHYDGAKKDKEKLAKEKEKEMKAT